MDKITYDFKIRIRPCPFCHSQERPKMFFGDGGAILFMRCNVCGAAVKQETSPSYSYHPEEYFKAGIFLINKWNGVYDYKNS